jgi:sugar phosphate permease
MVGLTLATVLLWTVGVGSASAFVGCLLLIGFTLYGPDALMTGAGAMDIGSRRGAVLAAGIISGLGSFGPVVQEYVIGHLYDKKGGDLAPIFLMLLVSSVLSTSALVVMVLRGRAGKASV